MPDGLSKCMYTQANHRVRSLDIVHIAMPAMSGGEAAGTLA